MHENRMQANNYACNLVGSLMILKILIQRTNAEIKKIALCSGLIRWRLTLAKLQ